MLSKLKVLICKKVILSDKFLDVEYKQILVLVRDSLYFLRYMS